jgi:hypothetical protein
MMQLSVLYRAYPEISKRTAIPFSDKAELMKFCVRSVARALTDIETEFIFFSDNCTEEQKRIVRDTMNGVVAHFRTIELGGVGNQRSFVAQLSEISRVRFGTVLILEDDYYVDAQDIKLNVMVITEQHTDYSTFYYPPDAERSIGGMVLGERDVSSHAGLRLTDLPSTTLTFFAKRETLLNDLDYFLAFGAGAHDSSVWLRLTGRFVWFLSRVKHRMFYRHPKLFGSIVKRYLLYMLKFPVRRRRLVFVGYGRSAHLDSEGVFNRFSLRHFFWSAAKNP